MSEPNSTSAPHSPHSTDGEDLVTGLCPSSNASLGQMAQIRVLWLSLEMCARLTGRPVKIMSGSALPVLSARSVNSSFSLAPGGNGGGGGVSSVGQGGAAEEMAAGGAAFSSHRGSRLDMTSSGFELRLKEAVRRCALVPMRSLQSAFPKPCAHFNADALLRLTVVTEVGISQWENMEPFRANTVVLVVLSPANLVIQPAHAVKIVQTVRQAYYPDTIFRCLVVDPDPALLATMAAPEFTPVYSVVPVEETAAKLVESIALASVRHLNTLILRYAKVSPDMDPVAVRTPLDRLGSGETLKRNMVEMRYGKKRGDLLAQLGAPEMAIAAFGATQFGSNVDSLWCSATLEAIAGARYQQLAPLLARASSLSQFVVDIQSEGTTWGPALSAPLSELETFLMQLNANMKATAAAFRSTSVPNSMRSRLGREVVDPMASRASALRPLLKRARACIAAGTLELDEDPYAYRIAGELKDVTQTMVQLAFAELHIYLNESLRQQRHISPPATALLRDREVETQWKIATLFAIARDRTAFFQQLRVLHRLFFASDGAEGGGGAGSPGGAACSSSPSAAKDSTTAPVHQHSASISSPTSRANGEQSGAAREQQRALDYMTLLCLRAGCRRRAVALLVESAARSRTRGAHRYAIQSLVRACVLSGVKLPLPTLTCDLADDPLIRMLLLQQQQTSSLEGSGGGGEEDDNGAPLKLGETFDGNEASLASTCISHPGASAFSLFNDGGLHPDHGTSKSTLERLQRHTSPLHAPLLFALIDVLAATSESGEVRFRLAALLLLQYASFLGRAEQQQLRLLLVELSAGLSPDTVPVNFSSVPLFAAWEALPLPPHLAPKTVSVGGALFTFIDTQRLKLTVLSLNGKKLNSRVVWSIGDVGSVLMTLYNPFRQELRLSSVALQCRSCATLDDHNRIPRGTETHTTGPLAPLTYVLTNLRLPALTTTPVLLQVQPRMEGYLRIEGLEMYFNSLDLQMPMEGRLPEPIGIPVLPRLPQVACAVSISELEIFSGQSVQFTVRVVNCGLVPIERITLTAHSEACQLEDCTGCMERPNNKESTVRLGKEALLAANSTTPWQPGDVVNIPATITAPTLISRMQARYVVFRVDCSLPHEAPTMPEGVPHAVPVFGVIPRRVTETRLRLFHAPAVAVASVALTKDRRYVDLRIANHSSHYSFDLFLSRLPFAGAADALIVAGGEYVVPPVDIGKIPRHSGLRFRVPWRVRGRDPAHHGHAAGHLLIDLGLVANETVSAEPLEECQLSIDVEIPPSGANHFLRMRHWQNEVGPSSAPVSAAPSSHLPVHSRCNSRFVLPGADGDDGEGSVTSRLVSNVLYDEEPPSAATDGGAGAHHRTGICGGGSECGVGDGGGGGGGVSGGGSGLPIVVPAVKPVMLHLHASAPWAAAVPLHFSITMDHHTDVGVLSGPVETTAVVGNRGAAVFEASYELFAFKTGTHVVSVNIRDSEGREATHHLRIQVAHIGD